VEKIVKIYKKVTGMGKKFAEKERETKCPTNFEMLKNIL
jgi:hypothetical protein